MNMIDTSGKDYDMVRRSLAFMTENWRDQPSLEAIAEKSGVSPHHMQRVFTRWAGLSPKAFLQAVTIDHARELLRDSASILDTAYEVGLSGPGRLHDLFVTHEGMSPGIYKARGKGLVIRHGGMVDKIVGDGLIAFFNAPVDQPSHAEQAVASAIDIIAASEAMRRAAMSKL